MEIRRILAPTDFSPSSRAALDHAVFIAGRFGARIDVLHVWQLPINFLPDWIVQAPGEPPQPITTLVEARAHAVLDPLVSELRAHGANVHAKLRSGDPAQEIVEMATRHQYDLVVMSTHGRTGLKRLWGGSVAEEVVRRAPCAVMTVRPPEDADS